MIYIGTKVEGQPFPKEFLAFGILDITNASKGFYVKIGNYVLYVRWNRPNNLPIEYWISKIT